jgi:hypothetical protein
LSSPSLVGQARDKAEGQVHQRDSEIQRLEGLVDTEGERVTRLQAIVNREVSLGKQLQERNRALERNRVETNDRVILAISTISNKYEAKLMGVKAQRSQYFIQVEMEKAKSTESEERAKVCPFVWMLVICMQNQVIGRRLT